VNAIYWTRSYWMRSNALVRRRSWAPLGLGCALAAACSDDEVNPGSVPTAGSSSGGSSSGGEAGTSNGGTAGVVGGSSGTGADAGAVGGSGPGNVDRDVFRPEERAPTPALVQQLRVPDGFVLSTFAEDLQHARMLATREADVYLTRPMQADVLRLRDTDGDGDADQRETVASGLTGVHGIAFAAADVYLATPKVVYRAGVEADGGFSTPAAIMEDLPDGGQHANRTLGIGPDGALYISVGSSCDACEETNPEHATLLRATVDGASRSVFARGLRNTIGFGWHPETGVLWGMDHGSDWRGADLPPEELNRIESGNDYGWPYCFGQRQLDPIIDDPPDTTKAAYCAATVVAQLETQAHNAPIGLVFYEADGFPLEYRGDAFVAMRGSWNRFPPTGYKIVRIVFDAAGEPTRFEDFVTGFLSDDGTSTFARPAGVTVAPDGSVLFTDDTNGVIYRVRHESASVADAGIPDGGEPGDAAADAEP
jgi:glucose/arabinose dehydrogenase